MNDHVRMSSILSSSHTSRANRLLDCNSTPGMYKVCGCCGRVVWHYGGPWQCRDRFCPRCSHLLFDRYAMRCKEHLSRSPSGSYALVTLAQIPPRLPLPQQLGLLARCWSELVSSYSWRFVSGAVRKQEVSWSQEGFNAHYHALLAAPAGTDLYSLLWPSLDRLRSSVSVTWTPVGSLYEARNVLGYFRKPECTGMDEWSDAACLSAVDALHGTKAWVLSGFFRPQLPAKSGAQICSQCGGRYAISDAAPSGAG